MRWRIVPGFPVVIITWLIVISISNSLPVPLTKCATLCSACFMQCILHLFGARAHFFDREEGKVNADVQCSLLHPDQTQILKIDHGALALTLLIQ